MRNSSKHRGNSSNVRTAPTGNEASSRMLGPVAQANAWGGEILERVQRALAVSYLVKDDQIVGQVHWSFRVHLDLEDERAGFEAVCKQALQARFLAEIKDLEEIFPAAQAMIMSGCGADANRFPAGSMTLAERHGKTQGEEVAPIAEQSLEAVRRDLGTA